MDINLHAATIALSRHGVTTLKDARGARILAVSGLLWITQDGDRRDYFLASGEELDITTDGAVVIEAQADSRLALLRPEALSAFFAPDPAETRPHRWLPWTLTHWLGAGRIDRMARSARLWAI